MRFAYKQPRRDFSASAMRASTFSTAFMSMSGPINRFRAGDNDDSAHPSPAGYREQRAQGHREYR
jgi:hypothetical protein